MSSVAGNVTGRLADLDAERTAYLRQANASTHVLNQFELRRQQIVLSGAAELSRRLTPASWDGLRSYINQDYRLNGTVFPGTAMPNGGH